MATLAELLAKKKAAAETKEETPAPVVKAESEATKTLAEPVKEEPAVAAPKSMSFAEKMALKKAATTTDQKTESTTSTDNGKNTIPEKEVVPNVVAAAPAVEQSAASPANIPASVDTTTQKEATTPVSNQSTADTSTEREEVSSEARQAYADIKDKLGYLNSLSGTDLESSMKELKKALMQNPAAVSLMEDSDIGQLVIALRKITGETIAEAAKEKKNGNGGGRKSKQVDLSDPNVVSAIFDEL